MTRKTFFGLTLAWLGMLMSCEDRGVRREVIDGTLQGSWLLVERGYSPGSGYHTDPVPADPPQTIRFHDDYQFSSSNITGLSDYRYYRILEDTARETTVVALFRTDPGNTTPDLATLEHSYTVSREGGQLKLFFRWCIEGCHLGFRRIDDHQQD